MQGIMAMLSRRAVLLLATTALALLGISGVASAATYMVNDTTDAPLATSGDTNCVSTNTTTAFPGGTCTLRAAVQAADNNGGANTITVPAGTYTYTIPPAGSTDTNNPATGDLDVLGSNQLTINGAGSGSTIIDPNHLDRAFSVAAGASLTMSGVKIQNGTAVTQLPYTYYYSSCKNYSCGGAIGAVGAVSLPSDVVLSNNSADYGGAVMVDYSQTTPPVNLTVDGATFTGNTATDEAGAIYYYSGAVVTLIGDTFTGNSASGATYTYGGAVSDEYGSSLRVADDLFSGNSAGYEGGAIYNDGGAAVTLNSNTFKGNSARYGGGISDEDSASFSADSNLFSGNTATSTGNTGAADGYGGGLYLDSCSAYVVNHDEFDSNAAGEGGGILTYCQLSADGTSMIGNTATTDGGAIYQDSGDPFTLSNATLAKNTAAYGGGIYYASSTPSDLVNDTLYQNSAGAAGQGGGIYETSDITPYTLGVTNTVIAGNTNGDCADGGSTSQVPAGADAGYNMDSDGSCFSAASDKKATPLLGAPADNGGPTTGSNGNTETIQTSAELAGSPTIDAGSNSNCPSTDARGVARPQGASCDIGSFESYLGAGQLSLSKTAPATASQGGVFEYTIDAGNKGPGVSSGTTVTDQLPAGLNLVADGPSQGSCSTTGTPAKVVCHLGTLAAGSGASVTIAVTPTQQGTVTNTASVGNDQGSSATASATTKVGPPANGGKPSASTGGAGKITQTSARLGGHVGNGGQRTGYFFEVGTTKQYGTVTSVQYVTRSKAIAVLVRHLRPATRYHYRLVAVNDAGTAYGRDRTFKTKGILGALLLDGSTLRVSHGLVSERFTCHSSISCYFRVSITIRVRAAGTHQYSTVEFLRGHNGQTLKRIGAGKSATVSEVVDPAALGILVRTPGGERAGVLSTGPRSGQKGIIKPVTLIG